MQPEPGEVTRLLHEVKNGDRQAEERLVQLVYKDLRRVAAGYLRKESPDHTLQPTALVHEAYMRLTRMEKMEWQSRSHYFGVAAKVMRNILVDHARAHQAGKRGQGMKFVGFDEALFASPELAPEIIAVHEALEKFATVDPRACQALEMRNFSGMTNKEIAEVMDLSVKTVQRDLNSAEAWLKVELKKFEKKSKKKRPNQRGDRSEP
jgi:RNA polymerase sigma-70 factor, ECF subfamily